MQMPSRLLIRLFLHLMGNIHMAQSRQHHNYQQKDQPPKWRSPHMTLRYRSLLAPHSPSSPASATYSKYLHSKPDDSKHFLWETQAFLPAVTSVRARAALWHSKTVLSPHARISTHGPLISFSVSSAFAVQQETYCSMKIWFGSSSAATFAASKAYN